LRAFDGSTVSPQKYAVDQTNHAPPKNQGTGPAAAARDQSHASPNETAAVHRVSRLAAIRRFVGE
jgi:hypothetical protein